MTAVKWQAELTYSKQTSYSSKPFKSSKTFEFSKFDLNFVLILTSSCSFFLIVVEIPKQSLIDFIKC